MTSLAHDARRDLPLALVAAATTWFTMFSWRGFSTQWGEFLGPLLVVALAVALGGAALRAAPMSRRSGLFFHVLLVLVVVWLMLGGSVLHPLASAHDIDYAIQDAWVSASTYAPPIPNTVPSIAPLMIPCGAASLLLVDILACWLHRVPLAGLPLLAVYCVPISLLGDGVPWLLFVIAAAGFMLMMFLQESAHIARWGRPLGASAAVDPTGFGVRTGASRASAGTVGGVAMVLAVILPLFIPTLHLDGLGLFGPGGGGNTVKVVNPITNMRRDLHRGKDVPLLDVKTDNPDPSYLRISVLTQFDGVEWTTGSRAVVSDQVADGLMPYPEQGLGPDVVTKAYNYAVHATNNFDSTWLPTQFPVSDIVAPGSWHFDTTTMDFFAGNSQTNTRGLSYRMTAAIPQLSAYAMKQSLTAPAGIQATYTALPTTLPPMVKQLALKVTRGLNNRYEMAVRLQDWFRNTGGFRYSLKAQPGDGNDALVQFLSRGHGGRVGYCEQFASAYAVMARALGIPARVAVGFLQPTKAANGDWVYSAHDLHAWPELYFNGSGWVRFEPTPSVRASAVPAYTTGKVHKPKVKQQTQSGGGHVTDPTSAATHKPHNQTSTPTSSASSGFSVPWAAVGGVLGGLAILVAAVVVPGAVRRSRRARRLSGGAEDAWAELRDTAVDLGVSWPAGRSPHETGVRLAGWFGPEPDGPPLVRPPRGRGLAPEAERALDRIVLMLEQVRYARAADDVPGALADDVRACIAALEHGCTRGTLRRATWFPRSVFRRAPDAGAVDVREPEAVSPGGVVDHVG